MSQILRCCNYYCAALTFLGAIFFGILVALELSKSEFIIETFHGGKSKASQYISILIVVGINVALFVFCLILVNKKPEEKNEEEDVDWKFIYKIERPQDISV